MNAIGGYFGLELNAGREYHEGNVLRLNTGRNAFEYTMLATGIKKVYIPYFTCDVMLEPLVKHNIEYSFYEINEQLEPMFSFSEMDDHAAFLYTNYFGLKDNFVKTLAGKCKHLIIDNAQSFYSKPVAGVSTFYSPRKFFGLADGAYLYCPNRLSVNFGQDFTSERMAHLLMRIDIDAESGYSTFCKNDKALENQPIRYMSALTQAMVKSINYESAAVKRIDNYAFFEENLSALNRLQLSRSGTQVPMVYPFWTDDKGLKAKLLGDSIYCASYWPNVLTWCDGNTIEYRLASEVIHLPVDQRYNRETLQRIINLIIR